jgi:hypothetical protein
MYINAWRLCRRSHTKVELKKLSLGSLDEGDVDNEGELDTSMDSATPTERHAMEYDSSDIGMVERAGLVAALYGILGIRHKYGWVGLLAALCGIIIIEGQYNIECSSSDFCMVGLVVLVF